MATAPPVSAAPPEEGGTDVVLDRAGLDALLEVLAEDGCTVVGPTVRDGAIVTGVLGSADDLPAGWTDEQAPGRYRLRRRNDGALFGHAVGPESPKRRFFAPVEELWRARRRSGDGATAVTIRPRDPADGIEPVALVGLKGCELAAIAVQDRVLAEGDHPDPHYVARRAGAVLVSVDCGDPAATCFCTSVGTGPVADGGGGVAPDVRLTELVDEHRHEFVARPGTPRGAELLARVRHRVPAACRPVGAADEAAAAAVTDAAVSRIDRHLPTDGLAAALAAQPDHPRWDDVAARCLSCTNCTMVCPTCFCSSVEDLTDLSGDEAIRRRRWDSCFTLEHSYVHGGAIHPTVRSRYRQWLTHKLSTWWDQFGTSGCVGCGRCIAWCPAGIDLVEEARAILGR
jgi:ferredoxin